ncbi:MAG TPA: hypothetical protein VFV72_01135 [Candidatus Limnocylindrales bacterium]|nr:hypothetical protein [Candidatus Limnocylindrales bacterium]
MLRQVDWAWLALGAVETHHERPRPAALRNDRVERIAPRGSLADRERAAAQRTVATNLPAQPALARGS